MTAPDTTPPPNGFSTFVIATFARWQQADLPFVILRNYEELPHATSHDVDVLVPRCRMAEAERILIAAAYASGFHLSNRAKFSPVSLFFFHPDTLAQAQFDLFDTLNWRGITILPARSVLTWRVERGLFAVPHPIHEAINNLMGRQIYHGYVKDKYKEFICATFTKYPQETETKLRRMAGRTVAEKITAAVLEQKWEDVEAQTRPLRRGLAFQRFVNRPIETPLQILSDIIRLTGRMLRPPGASIVLLGADGSGKSSVAKRLLDALHGTFYKDKSLHVHWKPSVFLRKRRSERAPTTDPHGQPPRVWLASQLVLLYHWLEYLAGGLLQFLPVLFRCGMVLIERHHYDFLVDPRRYRLQPPCALVRCAFRCLPKPDLVFVLDAPPELFQARKPEVTLEESRRQREAYLSLAARMPNARVIDGTQPLDLVVADIVRETLTHLEKRQMKRSKRHDVVIHGI